jgi:hypothetical protein
MADDLPTVLVTEETAGEGPVGLSLETGQRRSIDVSDKLTIINRALTATGNTPISADDETSDEWTAASSGFDRIVSELLWRRNWQFATRLQRLNRVGDSTWPGYQDVFAKPQDCLFFIDCYRPDIAALVTAPQSYWGFRDSNRAPDFDYKIIGDRIHCVAPEGAVALYTPFPVGAQPWSVGFTEVLTRKLEAFLLRALNEDYGEANNRLVEAEKALAEAAARNDQEEPRKTMFRSRLREARRFRRGGW